MSSVSKKLPSKLILSIKPKKYLQQGLSHCGAYSVKAILEAYGKDNKSHPKEYHPHWVGKLLGTTFGKQYYVRILNSYGVGAEAHNADKLSPQEKITLLKSLLNKNTPVMIRIGNGYWSGRRYSSFLGKIISHWVTLWGYYDEKKIFYVYDSGLSREFYKHNIPVGNTTRTYNEILRDWTFGRFHPLCWLIGTTGNNLYIKLNPKKQKLTI